MARMETLSETDLERALLRKGVGLLAAGRARCCSCGRSPLLGERVFVYARGKTVCALCRPDRRGEPMRSELVHGDARGATVRRLRAA